ncbi:MAG: tyrosine-protein phosphatase [Azospirillaceae bacterium]|nr:tyrosine-protein phosphatase [Azospirillaceae bacterium]
MLAGCPNFRDLGGLPTADGRRIRPGLLFRAGELHTLTDDDRALLQNLGLKLVVDLRTTRERAARPASLGDGHGIELAFHSYDHSGADLARARLEGAAALRDLMLSIYARLPFEQTPALRLLFIRVGEGRLPLLFHCAAGKDRTGAAAALLLTALGVSRPEIEADYLATNRHYDWLHARFMAAGTGMSPDRAEAARPLLQADVAYLHRLFETVESRHGTVAAYLSDVLGVDDDACEALRHQLLEP